MRKLFMLVTLTVSLYVFTGTAGAVGTAPECSPNCPWVR
jgi:hypothetical protein